MDIEKLVEQGARALVMCYRSENKNHSEELCRRLTDPDHFVSGVDAREAASLIRRLVQERDEARIELGNAGEDYREQEAKLRNTFFDAQSMKARATTAEALVAELREKAATIAKDLADRGYSGDAIAAAIRSSK